MCLLKTNDERWPLSSVTQDVYSPSVVSGADVVFYEDKIGGLTANLSAALAAAAASYVVAAQAGLLTRTTADELIALDQVSGGLGPLQQPRSVSRIQHGVQMHDSMHSMEDFESSGFMSQVTCDV